MAKILEEGCVAKCGHCLTRFSFDLSEVQHSIVPIPAGRSPEEEAYNKSVFTVKCPKCWCDVDVEKHIGPLAKKQLASRKEIHDL